MKWIASHCYFLTPCPNSKCSECDECKISVKMTLKLYQKSSKNIIATHCFEINNKKRWMIFRIRNCVIKENCHKYSTIHPEVFHLSSSLLINFNMIFITRKKKEGRSGSGNFFSPSGSSSLGTKNSLLATLNAWSRLVRLSFPKRLSNSNNSGLKNIGNLSQSQTSFN